MPFPASTRPSPGSSIYAARATRSRLRARLTTNGEAVHCRPLCRVGEQRGKEADLGVGRRPGGPPYHGRGASQTPVNGIPGRVSDAGVVGLRPAGRSLALRLAALGLRVAL